MVSGFAILQAKEFEQFLRVKLHLFSGVFHQQSPRNSLSPKGCTNAYRKIDASTMESPELKDM